ncbi:DELTA-actitoxin-Oor1b-like [Ornithorhynchus anatinus]|uniref:DELTA-actitoxin-Oor1b-like n=1 Tax=Ornithorhynchus anatinus TaxID=9258 RepID=UPI0010A820D8|nr:DELTA-actitoxin-Oor1b-like [Ornithorhynchus anatinus]
MLLSHPLSPPAPRFQEPARASPHWEIYLLALLPGCRNQEMKGEEDKKGGGGREEASWLLPFSPAGYNRLRGSGVHSLSPSRSPGPPAPSTWRDRRGEAHMEQTIEQLVHQVDSRRCVGIEVTNGMSLEFHSVRTYCYSGHTHLPPSPIIPPKTKRHCIFVKTDGAPRGSVGLLVYKIRLNLSLAILFSNPYDYNLYSIEFAVALYERDMAGTELDVLYDHIYKQKEQGSLKVAKRKLGSTQEPLVLKERGVRVSATMSNDAKAVIRVHVGPL